MRTPHSRGRCGSFVGARVLYGRLSIGGGGAHAQGAGPEIPGAGANGMVKRAKPAAAVVLLVPTLSFSAQSAAGFR